MVSVNNGGSNGGSSLKSKMRQRSCVCLKWERERLENEDVVRERDGVTLKMRTGTPEVKVMDKELVN